MFKKRLKILSRNKRGEEMLIDFWAILVFAVIVVLFFIIFSVNKTKMTQNIETHFAGKDADYMLEAFLRAPLVDDPSRTVSDVIVEDSTTGDFSDTEKLFGEYFQRTSRINGEELNNMVLRIEGDHDDTLRITAEKGKGWFGTAVTVQWEETKALFGFALGLANKDLSQAIGLSGHKDTETFTAETYLPGYTKRVHVRMAVVAWTYKTAAG